MSEVLKIVLPVIMMMIIGKFCNSFHILSKEGAQGIKGVLVNVVLPVALFNGMATAQYSLNVGIMFLVILFVTAGSFVLGFALRRFMRGKYERYVPYLVSVYEGGMIAYPLYSNICGAENLSNIAMLDLGCCLFCFSVFMTVLRMEEDGIRPGVLLIVKSALSSPTFLGAILGVFMGITGLMTMLLSSPVGELYQAAEAMITAPLTPMILLVVGFDLVISREMFGPCFKTVIMRLLVQTAFFIPAYFAVTRLFPGNRLMTIALLCYLSAPPSYSLPAFVKSDEGCAYVSTTNSMYCIATILIYIGIVILFV